VAYMSYRLGRRDLRLPSTDPDWRPGIDPRPDLEAGPGEPGPGSAEPEEGVDRPDRSELSELSEPAPPGRPGELVEGATARLWALLDAYPDLPDEGT